MTQAQALYHLQEIELAILATQKRLVEIEAKLGDNAAVTESQARVTEATKAISPNRARVRDLELEIQTTAQKAKATEDQLYSGSVKNPKALQDMQTEIESLKTWQSTLEDRLLEAMMALEEAEATLETHQSALETTQAEYAAQNADLVTEQTQLQTRLETLKAQRQNAAKPITPENLKLYTSMRPRKANQPMALLQEGGCGFCGVDQTMTIVQEVQRGDKLISCSNCGRILAYKG